MTISLPKLRILPQGTFPTGMAALLLALLASAASSPAAISSGYVDLAPRDSGALPTDTARLIFEPRARAVAIDPFNEYVPGLTSRYQLSLNPLFTLPHLHVPYLRRGRATADRANLAIPDWLYADLRLTLDAMFTDNVWRDNRNRKSDLVIQTVLTIDTTLQLTDDLQLQAAGNLVYHRAMGEDRIYGFGFQDYFYFADTFRADSLLGIEGNVLFVSQVRWQRQFGEWDFQVGDRFYIANRLMDDPFIGDRLEQATETANIAGAALGRLLPGELRLGLAAERGDYWYNSRFRNYARTEHSGKVWLDTRREAMRFRPYTEYTVRHIDYSHRDQDGLAHEARAGLRGPVTDQMNVETSVAYSRTGNSGSRKSEEMLWRLWLDHLMNSTTRHNVLAERRLTPAADSLQGTRTRLQYKIGHRLQRRTTCWLGINRTTYDDQPDRSTQNWGFLASTVFSPARRMDCTLEYQYIDWSSNRQDRDYTENRVTLSVAWNI